MDYSSNNNYSTSAQYNGVAGASFTVEELFTYHIAPDLTLQELLLQILRIAKLHSQKQ